MDDDRPLIEANFESKLIDLSALPPAADSTTAHNTRVFSTDPLPLDALGQLDAKISLLVGRLQTAEVTLETLRAVAELERSELSVDEFTATIAGGRVEAEVLLDARREVPRFAKTAHIDDMALAPFLGGSDVASGGIADLDVQISGEGASLAEIMGSADGYIKVDVGTLEISNKAAGIASAEQVIEAIAAAVPRGLALPIVYNTSAYDALASLRLLDGIVDIYMPDFKFWQRESARRLAKAKDYPERARAAILEMQRQVGSLRFGPDGLARRGLLVRHLVMPGEEAEAQAILQWLADEVATDTYVNVMSQYRPTFQVGANDLRSKYRDIDRRPRDAEMEAALSAARSAGLRIDKRSA